MGAQRIAVIGAGPAGLTAAHRLRMAGHHPTVLESAAVAGGRTHTQHHGPGHWTDDGAGWLGTFYPDTLALLQELGLRDRLRVLPLRGGGDLLVEGRLQPNPNSIRRILGSRLLSPADKARFMAWMARLFLTQPGQLRMDDRLDGTTAAATLAGAGAAATAWVVRPSFEGPFFSRLDELSGALVRSWMRALSVGTFFQVEGGMDSPWRDLAGRLDARLGVPVEHVAPAQGGVEVHVAGQVERYDGVVVAVPAPVAAQIVAGEALPRAVGDIEYAPHVRVYLARRGPAIQRSGVHAFPNETVATVELGAGGDGAWGRVPQGWQWALLCAPAASSGRLLGLSDEALVAELWAAGSAIDARLFPLDTAEIVHVVRWRHAVPRVGVGYLAGVRSIPQRPPIVFAGDWLVQPCVEGAVRSGIAAAAAFGATGSANAGPANAGPDAAGGAR
ncbi:MAG: FAD-dependent oxidoreductase [Chloroflexota bacterium]